MGSYNVGAHSFKQSRFCKPVMQPFSKAYIKRRENEFDDLVI